MPIKRGSPQIERKRKKERKRRREREREREREMLTTVQPETNPIDIFKSQEGRKQQRQRTNGETGRIQGKEELSTRNTHTKTNQWQNVCMRK